jgi:predicted homoserine dehydrogenase-like protein
VATLWSPTTPRWCRSPEIDVILDVTGAGEFGARVALDAFAHGKHVVLRSCRKR